MARANEMTAVETATASVGRTLFLYLLFLTLINIHIMSHKEHRDQERVTARWVAWGVMFTLLGFFIITPEQEAQAKMHVHKKNKGSQ